MKGPEKKVCGIYSQTVFMEYSWALPIFIPIDYQYLFSILTHWKLIATSQ